MVVAFTAAKHSQVLPCIKSSIVIYSKGLMAQILDHLPSDNSDPMLCCYVNASSKMQIVRITNIHNWYFERVVFPGQRLMFEAFPEAQLEIHTGMMASAILSDTILCKRLAVAPEDAEPWEKQIMTEPDKEDQAAVSVSS